MPGDAVTTVALRCVDVRKSFPIQKDLRVWRILFGLDARGGTIEALRGITMSVPRGKIVGILGKNGSGKSTLLRVLGGVYQPTGGRVDSDGEIAGLFELGGMGNPNLTGREYARRYLRVMGARFADSAQMLEEICDFAELNDAFDQHVRTYSSGMAARLYFATATALQKEIYLIDELLSVGDEHFQAKCWQRMRQRLLQGASGVLVTHDWTAVLKLCEQAHVIEKGKFRYSGASDQVVVSYLNIPVPVAGVASFSNWNNYVQVFQARSQADIVLWIDLFEPVSVDVAVSIEMMRVGIGWEIVLLSGSMQVAEQRGRYCATVSIADLPLSPGEYSLNAFLTRRKSGAQEAAVILDSRSWTTGNGYRIKVEGPSVQAAVQLPFTARTLEART